MTTFGALWDVAGKTWLSWAGPETLVLLTFCFFGCFAQFFPFNLAKFWEHIGIVFEGRLSASLKLSLELVQNKLLRITYLFESDLNQIRLPTIWCWIWMAGGPNKITILFVRFCLLCLCISFAFHTTLVLSIVVSSSVLIISVIQALSQVACPKCLTARIYE